ANPVGTLAVDAAGNVYGTTTYGGSGGSCEFGNGCGVAWEITPSPRLLGSECFGVAVVISPYHSLRANERLRLLS
ncbi:MAG: hypothetical protein WCC25_20770, partial [Candidatus Korobacteraceae bacterium]